MMWDQAMDENLDAVSDYVLDLMLDLWKAWMLERKKGKMKESMLDKMRVNMLDSQWGEMCILMRALESLRVCLKEDRMDFGMVWNMDEAKVDVEKSRWEAPQQQIYLQILAKTQDWDIWNNSNIHQKLK